MSGLTDAESRLMRDSGRDGQMFRAGASAEARYRNADTVLHHELLGYVKALCECHPDWSDQRILESALRVFADGAHALSEAARVELEAIPEEGDPS